MIKTIEKQDLEVITGHSTTKPDWSNLNDAERMGQEIFFHTLFARETPIRKTFQITKTTCILTVGELLTISESEEKDLSNCVYTVGHNGNLFYIGTSTSVRIRIKNHCNKNNPSALGTWMLPNLPFSLAWQIEVMTFDLKAAETYISDNDYLNRIERELIKRNRPLLNTVYLEHHPNPVGTMPKEYDRNYQGHITDFIRGRCEVNNV